MTSPDPVRRIRPIAEEDPATELRTVLGRFATGVTVLTAGGERAHGMTANAFSSVSLAPPMALCCVTRTARLHDAVLATRSFGVSVLSGEQEDVARWFADRGRPSGWAQFDAFPTRLGRHTGVPLVEGALAWIECSLAAVHGGGDHSIFLGTVLSHGLGAATTALSFFGGSYQQLDPAAGSGPAARLKEAS